VAPTREQCIELLKKYSMPENIMQHSLKVTKVALFIGKKLREKGEEIDLNLLECAALLHDIDKKICLEDVALVHGAEGAKILEKEGLSKIAQIVREHRLGFVRGNRFSSLESKVVYYSDKRVNHEKIVSLDERFEYLIERYGVKGPDVKKRIINAKPLVEALEKELLEKSGADPKLEGL